MIFRYLLLTLLFINTDAYAINDSSHRVIAIKNVNIIPMTQGGNTVIENATVVIIDNIITSINENIPDSALTIDGKNKWLIPGLIDMHVHALADINFNQTGPTK